jgi:NAD(P)-dependent dehydrogenase (short-subunit alcohol dehydrogenase family)
MKLKNKTAIVTGGNSGIGFATAKELIAQGARVLITGRKKDLVDKAAKALGNGTIGLVSDQSKLGDIDALVSKAKDLYGQVDILFINAGVAKFVPFDQVSENQFDETMDVNFKGAFFTLQKFLPLLNEGASVTFLSSINAFTAMPNTAVYAPSKAALNSLARTAAYELAARKIRVNAINPGPIATPIFDKIGLSKEAITEFSEVMQKRIPLKRFGQPEEVGKLVAFISSDDASFITGVEYNIDGGVGLNPILA